MTNFSELRKNMVDCQIRPNDITDRRLLGALLEVPREQFVTEDLINRAYIDCELALTSPSGETRVMMACEPQAQLINLGDIKSSDLVLDIASLSGYSTAIIAQLADSVVALESDEGFANFASENLQDLGIGNAAVITGPLEKGHAVEGPYDVIIINGTVDEVPEEILQQLKPTGRLVTSQIENGCGRAVVYRPAGEAYARQSIMDMTVPPLKAFDRAEEFVF